MMGFRELLRSKGGQYVAAALVLIGVAAAGYSVWSNLGESNAAAMSRGRTFVDAETGRGFRHELTAGEPIPVVAPSGKKTGYPAELCYWTKEGTPKQEPTPVLLNHWVGKQGPTFCPECGRLVVGHNPPAEPGAKAPPTKEEYEARGGGGGGGGERD